MQDKNSRLVYSTDTGRIDEEKVPVVRPKGDGIVRIQRQTSGRKGKGVCLITGLDIDDAELQKLAAELKKKCGCNCWKPKGIKSNWLVAKHYLKIDLTHPCCFIRAEMILSPWRIIYQPDGR